MAGEDNKDKGGEIESKTITVDGDKPLESIEITIADEGDGGAVETKDGKQPDDKGGEKKPRNSIDRRIGKAVAAQREAETTAQRLQRENDELRAQNEKQGKDLQIADRAAFNNHAARTASDLKIAKSDLVKAQEDLGGGVEGAAERVAEATAEVGRLAAEQARVEAWKKAHPEPEPGAKAEPKTESKPKPQGQQQKQFTPELQSFLDRNPWFVPNTGDFDQDMHVIARNFATRLEKKFDETGEGPQEGTPEYFEAIESHVRKMFPDYEWPDAGDGDGGGGQQQRGLPRMNGDNKQVSSRSASNGGGPQANGSGTKILLTGDQRQFVRGMVDQGAYGINPETKKPYTYAEAEVRYARQVKIDRDNQRQKAGG